MDADVRVASEDGGVQRIRAPAAADREARAGHFERGRPCAVTEERDPGRARRGAETADLAVGTGGQEIGLEHGLPAKGFAR